MIHRFKTFRRNEIGSALKSAVLKYGKDYYRTENSSDESENQENKRIISKGWKPLPMRF